MQLAKLSYLCYYSLLSSYNIDTMALVRTLFVLGAAAVSVADVSMAASTGAGDVDSGSSLAVARVMRGVPDPTLRALPTPAAGTDAYGDGVGLEHGAGLSRRSYGGHHDDGYDYYYTTYVNFV